MAARYIGSRLLTVSQQAMRIRATRPGFTVDVERRSRLVATGVLCASRISGLYEVRIEYRLREQPRTFVVAPILNRRPSEPQRPIPHTYDSDKPGQERPCVYLPGTDWDATKSIAATIIPWLQCWITDYETWRTTGVWFGGGVSHAPQDVQPHAD